MVINLKIVLTCHYLIAKLSNTVTINGNRMAINNILCIVCNGSFFGSSNAKYCSNKCKQAQYRQNSSSSGFIYKLKRNGVVVYVGQSNSKKGVDFRVASHKSGEDKKIFDDYEVTHISNSNLNETEAREIINENPMYNKRLPSNSAYITVKQFSLIVAEIMEGFIERNCHTHVLGDKKLTHNTYVSINDKEELISQLLDGISKENTKENKDE